MSEDFFNKKSKYDSSVNISWIYFIIIIINTVFGLQILSSFFSLLVNFLRERPGISLYHVAIYAFVTFAIVFLAGFLFKFIKKRTLFLILIISISILRFLIQVCRLGSISLIASALGTAFWIISIIFFISLIQQRKTKLFFTFFTAIISGFTINTALNGLFGTWDMVWRLDSGVILFVVFMLIVQISLSIIIRNDIEDDSNYFDGTRAAFYSLTAIMPFIFLQLYQFQNIAAFNAKTGLKTVESLSIIIFSNLAALIFVYIIKIRKLRIFLLVVSAIIFVLAFWPEIKGLAYVFQIILGNIAGWCLIFVAVERALLNPGQKNPWKNTSALALSGILLFIFAFIYYGSYDLNLPLESWMIVAFAATIIAILGLVSAFLGSSYRGHVSDEMSSRSDSGVNKKPECLKNNLLKYIAVFLLLSLFIIPVIIVLPVENRAETRTQKDQVRLMHYNIHQGFNIDGYQDLESIARVIEKNDADIICLNEVSRGWVINGSADNYTWLTDRLKMDYAIFMPASDLVWGNAILSRYPLELIKSGFLPRMDAPLRRSYIYAKVDMSDLGIENINIISTHLHQIEGEGEKRKAQIESLLEEWDSTKRTVICGDFNAVTEDEEIQMVADAGLIDSQFALGKQDELTWVHYKPYRRIDYIWVTPDLEISDLLVTFSRASDHLPISLLIK